VVEEAGELTEWRSMLSRVAGDNHGFATRSILSRLAGDNHGFGTRSILSRLFECLSSGVYGISVAVGLWARV
jgi:hypothetical protein